jgi:hypothetical protein|tara:strand:+ start:1050 stop:1157 length:108 start_codon:yes stop_codon:yes gene_type:complete
MVIAGQVQGRLVMVFEVHHMYEALSRTLLAKFDLG